MIRSDRYLLENASSLGIDRELINPASVDLKLGVHFHVWLGWTWLDDYYNTPVDTKHPGCNDYIIDETIPISNDLQYWTKEVILKMGQEVLFEPNMFYLAHSEEIVTIPRDKAARLYLKSLFSSRRTRARSCLLA